MPQADALEKDLTSRLNAISRNLHNALRSHSRQTHDDVSLALLENARLTINFHKHTLRELEALKPDISRIGSTGPVLPVSAPLPPPPSMTSRTYTTPTAARPPPPLLPVGAAGGSVAQSMVLPPPTVEQIRPGSADPLGVPGGVRAGGPNMAQSMMLPGQRKPAPRRLDERQAAKLLSGGF